MHDPRHRVALVLALCVFVFYTGGMLVIALIRLFAPDIQVSGDLTAMWGDVTKTLIGGLLVYIAGKSINGDDNDK